MPITAPQGQLPPASLTAIKTTVKTAARDHLKQVFAEIWADIESGFGVAEEVVQEAATVSKVLAPAIELGATALGHPEISAGVAVGEQVLQTTAGVAKSLESATGASPPVAAAVNQAVGSGQETTHVAAVG
jgi:hypothetical protein